MTRRNLILIHRGPKYEQDFAEISTKIFALDPDITIYSLATGTTDQLPQTAWQRPTLTVALNAKFNLEVKRGPVLKNHQIDKLVQYRIFREAGLPTPPTLPFKFGMQLDPIMFGEFVLIKPMSLTLGSQGRGVQLFRRKRLERMTSRDFSPDHLIHKAGEGFLVQKFIDTGELVSYNRVSTFFSEPMYSYFSRAKSPRGSLGSPDELIEKLPITNNASSFRERSLRAEEDIVALAKRVHDAFPDIPLLGTDILREQGTGKLLVIECNPGGNTWHFSSQMNMPLRLALGKASLVGPKKAHAVARQMHIDQFNAFDRAARVLTEKTQALAR
ncbi:MAG TPA: hypothetical protein VM144_18200 [Aestuariivirga sp.]|nr:hypothetical protein [Aestuariivirga sp.]